MLTYTIPLNHLAGLDQGWCQQRNGKRNRAETHTKAAIQGNFPNPPEDMLCHLKGQGVFPK